MKKCALALALALLLTAASGCAGRNGGGTSESAADSSAGSEETLTLSSLSVELPRELDTAAAGKAMAELPERMAEFGVKIGSVSVTYGTSHAATGQALADGGVQLAFLPAADFLACGGGAAPILADAQPALSADGTDPAAWNTADLRESGGWSAGTFALICAAPTELGENLAARAAAGGKLSWEEISRARWGVLEETSNPGNRCAELWLEDHFDGNGLADLDSVTVYSGWEDLLRAAAAGEIDLMPLGPEIRQTYADLWTMETTKTGESGAHGFGRGAEILTEVPAVAVTDRLYSWVAAVTPGDAAVNDARFQSALAQALEELFPSPAERQSALGAAHFAPVSSGDLDGLRRLTLGTDSPAG